MDEKLEYNYMLNIKDLIEAEHLEKTSYKYSNFLNPIFLIYFLLLALISIYRIKDHNFFVIPIAKLNFDKSDIDYVQDAGWNLLFLILFFVNLFPKYNPFIWYDITNKYKQNFVNQELKTISISNEGITVISENYRESRKWQNFSKILENKQIFLLFHSRNKETLIIPKRIFDNETQLNIFHEFIGIIQSQAIE